MRTSTPSATWMYVGAFSSPYYSPSLVLFVSPFPSSSILGHVRASLFQPAVSAFMSSSSSRHHLIPGFYFFVSVSVCFFVSVW
eukprot:m.102556 g.102556  ORF g.102556 m.102556 type:complete len:83 (+) comp51540_c1_seq1:1332-1580(+)